ncbi:hypothetical protein [Flavobacterium branchiophilum]|uniref:Lipoprotein n=1 Tax=Flavobacterium branchiophilum TaxID=55197 RepID=A0A543G551_9FLAO|nr:hypothetical protein [Flavobacterium branchiophilum]TQM41199.1 hypothetical protein BC670_2141 [Flavobacterium branchiophilum]
MKCIFNILLIFCSFFGFSQAKMTKEEAKKKAMEMMNSKGTIVYETNGSKTNPISANMMFANGKYIIGTIMNKMRTDAAPGNFEQPFVLLVVDAISEGVHEFSKTYKQASGISSNGKMYEIRGSLKIKQLNGKYYGSFSGELIDIVKRDGAKKKEDRVDEKAKAGKITGTFSELTLLNFNKK